MATAPTKPTTPVKKEGSSATGMFAVLAIPICLLVAVLIYLFILGDPSHYAGGDPEKGLPQDVFGTIHRGGKIVPVIMGFVLMVIVFSIERAIVIGKAAGTGNMDSFVRKIVSLLNAGNIDGANAECDKQKGSVANVIKSGLKKYREMEADNTLTIDQKNISYPKRHRRSNFFGNAYA